MEKQRKAGREKLDTLVKERQVAAERRQEAQKAADELAKKQTEIAEKKDEANNDLSKAEPALLAA